MTAAPILAAYDGHAPTAVRLGDALARLLDLPLHVATAYRYDPVALSARATPGSVNEHRFEAAERGLDRVLATIRPGVEVERSTVPAERIGPSLVDLAVELDAVAIVVGCDERGHVTREIAAAARCPVVVAPVDELLLPDRLHAIGVAFDGSVTSRFALAAAYRLAIASGAWLELLAVHDADTPAAALRTQAEEAAAALERVEVRCTFPRGRPAEQLRHASEHLDLLACGSHGRGRLLSAVLGSVSARLVAEPACPTLLVPARARRDSAAPLGLTTARAR